VESFGGGPQDRKPSLRLHVASVGGEDRLERLDGVSPGIAGDLPESSQFALMRSAKGGKR
jgi:hypothetical protein